jgi:hypothetical protein
MKPCPVAPAERPGDASELLDRFPLGAAQARAAWVLQPYAALPGTFGHICECLGIWGG